MKIVCDLTHDGTISKGLPKSALSRTAAGSSSVSVMDAGPVDDRVWPLLEYVIPLTPNLLGITFKFHESSFRLLGEDGILEEVNHARTIVNNHVASSLSTSAG